MRWDTLKKNVGMPEKKDTDYTEIEGMPEKKDTDYAELLLDELRKDDELFTSRLNLFLVAEALLLLSYATFMNIQGIDEKIIVLI